MRDKIIDILYEELRNVDHSLIREWEHLQSESKYKKLNGIYPFIYNIRRYEAQKNFIEILIDKYEEDAK
jgi:hypothetical protein